jgi:hypothetical protein
MHSELINELINEHLNQEFNSILKVMIDRYGERRVMMILTRQLTVLLEDEE